MIDTHCHIDFEEFDHDREDVINRAREVLEAVVDSGTSYESNQTVLDISKKNPDFIYPSFGYHPVASHTKTPEDVKQAQNFLIKHLDEYVAIGEVGMDYYYVTDKSLREKQEEIFTSFVEIANEYKKTLLIHGRDCEKKVLNIIKEYDNIPYVIFHCYSGSLKTARKIMEYDNYYMSFSTMVCYSKQHQELVKNIPLEHILTETDSPYLALSREERNEPAFVMRGARKIAELKEVNLKEIDEITSNNGKKVFNI